MSNCLDSLSRKLHYLSIHLLHCLESTKERPLIVGVNGPQGCGKSTLCRELCQHLRNLYGVATETVSLDDYYLPTCALEQLYLQTDHSPLYQFRGNPGTHDVALLARLVATLKESNPNHSSLPKVPLYDKLGEGGRGERRPMEEWRTLSMPVDLLLLEGWMVGFTPIRDMSLPCDLALMNAMLEQYLSIWHSLHAAILFRIDQHMEALIYEWRIEQEREVGKATDRMIRCREDLIDFIGRFMPAYRLYYQSLSQDLISHIKKDMILQVFLDERRNFILK